jgi:hypothetical protein
MGLPVSGWASELRPKGGRHFRFREQAVGLRMRPGRLRPALGLSAI